MPNIASVLKDEITRLARKELKSETASLKKAVATYRHEIATLKRKVAALEKQVRRVEPKAPRTSLQGPQDDEGLRFRAAGFAQHRKRLGLSASDVGKLIGASQLSVYKWESGKAKPRRSYLPAIAALRRMGKREATKRLAELV
ncbi:helix-turn-helix transcriptional regulator [Caenimonas sedimenti]|uniref:Helix-turn-helix transcriptional regulator n=1 Tax=Caenimonas sedimenti TaxID=2596921 RepID=A0A562ZKW1_9BURK|nr:helix-turn-helix transcriptional regulator [Caenimonas sedimenti]TWO69123.1 helix-turn-helix transcriptional regulator [Caenimonas sedimenti]